MDDASPTRKTLVAMPPSTEAKRSPFSFDSPYNSRTAWAHTSISLLLCEIKDELKDKDQSKLSSPKLPPPPPSPISLVLPTQVRATEASHLAARAGPSPRQDYPTAGQVQPKSLYTPFKRAPQVLKPIEYKSCPASPLARILPTMRPHGKRGDCKVALGLQPKKVAIPALAILQENAMNAQSLRTERIALKTIKIHEAMRMKLAPRNGLHYVAANGAVAVC